MIEKHFGVDFFSAYGALTLSVSEVSKEDVGGGFPFSDPQVWMDHQRRGSRRLLYLGE